MARRLKFCVGYRKYFWGWDVGNVTGKRKAKRGLVDEVFDVTSASALNALLGTDVKIHLLT